MPAIGKRVRSNALHGEFIGAIQKIFEAIQQRSIRALADQHLAQGLETGASCRAQATWTRNRQDSIVFVRSLVVLSKSVLKPILCNDANYQWHQKLYERVADHKRRIVRDAGAVVRKSLEFRFGPHRIHR